MKTKTILLGFFLATLLNLAQLSPLPHKHRNSPQAEQHQGNFNRRQRQRDGKRTYGTLPEYDAGSEESTLKVRGQQGFLRPASSHRIQSFSKHVDHKEDQRIMKTLENMSSGDRGNQKGKDSLKQGPYFTEPDCDEKCPKCQELKKKHRHSENEDRDDGRDCLKCKEDRKKKIRHSENEDGDGEHDCPKCKEENKKKHRHSEKEDRDGEHDCPKCKEENKKKHRHSEKEDRDDGHDCHKCREKEKRGHNHKKGKSEEEEDGECESCSKKREPKPCTSGACPKYEKFDGECSGESCSKTKRKGDLSHGPKRSHHETSRVDKHHHGRKKEEGFCDGDCLATKKRKCDGNCPAAEEEPPCEGNCPKKYEKFSGECSGPNCPQIRKTVNLEQGQIKRKVQGRRRVVKVHRERQKEGTPSDGDCAECSLDEQCDGDCPKEEPPCEDCQNTGESEQTCQGDLCFKTKTSGIRWQSKCKGDKCPRLEMLEQGCQGEQCNNQKLKGLSEGKIQSGRKQDSRQVELHTSGQMEIRNRVEKTRPVTEHCTECQRARQTVITMESCTGDCLKLKSKQKQETQHAPIDVTGSKVIKTEWRPKVTQIVTPTNVLKRKDTKVTNEETKVDETGFTEYTCSGDNCSVIETACSTGNCTVDEPVCMECLQNNVAEIICTGDNCTVFETPCSTGNCTVHDTCTDCVQNNVSSTVIQHTCTGENCTVIETQCSTGNCTVHDTCTDCVQNNVSSTVIQHTCTGDNCTVIETQCSTGNCTVHDTCTDCVQNNVSSTVIEHTCTGDNCTVIETPCSTGNCTAHEIKVEELEAPCEDCEQIERLLTIEGNNDDIEKSECKDGTCEPVAAPKP